MLEHTGYQNEFGPAWNDRCDPSIEKANNGEI